MSETSYEECFAADVRCAMEPMHGRDEPSPTLPYLATHSPYPLSLVTLQGLTLSLQRMDLPPF